MPLATDRAVHVMTEAELRRVVGFGREELAAIEAVYPLISARVGSMPPVMRIDVPEHRGEIDVKAAYLPGADGIAVKVSSGFFDNPAHGLPSLGGLMLLLDAETGVPRAAMFDNGYLTDLRTALAGAVAADHLAVADADAVGMLGAGMQARLQLEALRLVRPIGRARVWARQRARAEAFAAETSAHLGITVEVAGTPAEAIHDVAILVTTTPADDPLVRPGMLHPGLHVTAVGSDAEHKQELAGATVVEAEVFVCDSIEQSRRLGELRGAVLGGYDPARALELGEVVGGTATGRTSAEDVTICDLTGTGAQDAAIATLALRRCLAAGTGTRIAT